MAKRRKHEKLKKLAPRGHSPQHVVAIRKADGALPRGYAAFLTDLKLRVKTAQIRATASVNRELIELYWAIGRDIVQRQRNDGWGNAVVTRLAIDLHREFSETGGFSSSNIWRMRSFFLAYASWSDGDGRPAKLAQPVRVLHDAKPPQPVADIPWGHNILLIEKLKDPEQRIWYARQTIANGWSRNMLAHWIDSQLHKRQGKSINNFHRTLPPAQSDLANQAIKDPYVFELMTIAEDAREKELEDALLSHITRFLLELGAGFAFLGRQYRLSAGGEDYPVDLLFYHVRLHCYLIIDLKTGAFMPEYVGKMNFYLSTADEQLRGDGDQPSIGLILCRQKNGVLVEYALRDVAKPIGISEWTTRLTDSLPKRLQGKLPTIAQIESELAQITRNKGRKTSKRK